MQEEGIGGAGGNERGRREGVGGEGGSVQCQLPVLGGSRRKRQEGWSERGRREKERGRGGTAGRGRMRKWEGRRECQMPAPLSPLPPAVVMVLLRRVPVRRSDHLMLFRAHTSCVRPGED